jgi:hypothetical protein
MIRETTAREIRWPDNVACVGQIRSTDNIFIEYRELVMPCGRSRRKDNIKMYLKEIG